MIDYDRDQIEPEYGDFVSIPEDSHEAEEGSDHPSCADRPDQGECRHRRESAKRQAELPSPLYRLRILHSNETFFAWYDFPGTKPNFRTIEALEEALEGPLHSPLTESTTQGALSGPPGAAPEGALPGMSPDSGASPDGAPDGALGAVLSVALSAVPDGAPDAALSAAPAAESAADAGNTSSPDAGRAPVESAELTASIASGPAAASGPTAASGQPEPVEPLIPARTIVVAPTRYGRDLCEVQGLILDLSVVNPDEVVLIEKPAGLDELRKLKANQEKETKAYELCRQKIWSRNLPMKLVSAHYMLDEPKIIFYFSAESRVDFRELVKDLVSVFKMRIELRQIGVRDEARVTGGCGVCGRILCCRGVSDKLNPVSIKMAKDQNLSLNSLKISGPCGRLLCCLAYEFQFYRDARRELPSEGARFNYDGTLFRVVEVNPLSGSVKMAGEDGRLLDMAADRFHFVEGRWQVKD